jgi:hypothetical protein
MRFDAAAERGSSQRSDECERKLWCAVIGKAWEDLTQRESRPSLQFFEQRGGMFDEICEHLGMDASQIRSRARQVARAK